DDQQVGRSEALGRFHDRIGRPTNVAREGHLRAIDVESEAPRAKDVSRPGEPSFDARGRLETGVECNRLELLETALGIKSREQRLGGAMLRIAQAVGTPRFLFLQETGIG